MPRITCVGGRAYHKEEQGGGPDLFSREWESLQWNWEEWGGQEKEAAQSLAGVLYREAATKASVGGWEGQPRRGARKSTLPRSAGRKRQRQDPGGQEESQPGGAAAKETTEELVVGRGQILRVWKPPGHRGPEPRQGLPRQRRLSLPSQGQTVPGLQGHHRAGEDKGQVGPTPIPLNPTAGGCGSGSQAKGCELCRWRGRSARRDDRPGQPGCLPTPSAGPSDRVIQGFTGQASSTTYQLCGLGPGTPRALCKLCKGARLGSREAAIQAALISCPLRNGRLLSKIPSSLGPQCPYL